MVTTEPTAIGASDQDLAPGAEAGEYRIEAAIGKGGFGTVYRAVHPVIGKLVAIKVLARRYAADPDVVSRFVAEARAVNQIRHRNIIDIFSFGQLPDGRHYYVMEYLDGEPLDRIVRAGPMALADALPILRALARALDAAHAKGIAHRDLKPENIFVARDADGATYPKLLDFGIAKLLDPAGRAQPAPLHFGPEGRAEPAPLHFGPEDDVRHRTGTGVPIGTPYYMSPEQCRGRDVDHRTDIYSFGVVAYRLLTGAYPFEGDDYMDLLVKQVNDEPVPPSSRNPALPATVDAAIAWMMRKDRGDRPTSLLAAVTALDPSAATSAIPRLRSNRRTAAPSIAPPLGSTDPLAATTASSPPKHAPTTSPRRSRGPLWIGGALVLVASFTLVVHTMGGRDQTDESSTRGRGGDPILIGAQPFADAWAVTTVEAVDDVEITIDGAPDRTEISIGETRLGHPPRIRIPRDTHEVHLDFALGARVDHVAITPDRDQHVTVKLGKPVPNSSWRRPNSRL